MKKGNKHTIKKNLTQNHPKKHLIKGKYILLCDLQKNFKLDKKISDDILSRIMKYFWEGKFNLISLPFLCELCKIPLDINGRRTLDPVFLNRESLWHLLQGEITGKKRVKARPDLITEQLEYKDGEDTLYEPFICEDWSFYRRIINRLKRNQKSNQENYSILLPFIHLTTLSIELEDLIGILKEIELFPEKEKKVIHRIYNLHGSYLKNITKLSNEFIFSEFIRQKKIDCNKKNEDIASNICKMYPERLESPKRTLRIIYEEQKKSIERQIKQYRTGPANKNDNKTSTIDKILDEPDIINKIAKDNFITTNQVKKVLKNRKIADSAAMMRFLLHLIEYSK